MLSFWAGGISSFPACAREYRLLRRLTFHKTQVLGLHKSAIGLHISLKWDIAEIVKKVSKQFYFLCQLKRAKIHPKDLLTSYLICVRPSDRICMSSLYITTRCQFICTKTCPTHYISRTFIRRSKRLLTLLLNPFLRIKRQFLTNKLFKQVVNDYNINYISYYRVKAFLIII